MSALTPLAVGFVNPALLAGIILVALPIIIHLLSRRRFRRVPWAATRFLLEAEKENRRRVRFEQWLLLALRCLALLLLALLVARPFVEPGLLASLLGGRTHVQRFIVLDDSASLGYRAGTEPEFDALRSASVRLLRWLQSEAPTDPVTLYVTSDPAAPWLENTAPSAATYGDLIARVARHQPTVLRAEPARVMTRIAQQLAQPGAPLHADLYLFSDFQRSDWLLHNSAARAAFEPLRETADGNGAQRPPALRVMLVASGVSARENVAVLGVEFERPHAIAGLPALASVRVGNYTPRAAGPLTLRLEIDGAAQPPVTVDALEPGAEERVAVEVQFPEPGYRALAVSLSQPDAFAADDAARVATPVREALQVLIVNGAPAVESFDDEVYLLRNALAPPGPFASGLRINVIDAQELEGADLAGEDVVFACNLPPPDAGAVDALQRYVRAGGGLVLFLGSEAGSVEDHNRAWRAGDDSLLPLPLERLVTTDTAAGVGLVRTSDHPLTAMFSTRGAALSEYIHFRQYFRVAESAVPADADPNEPPDSKAALRTPRILARYTDLEQTPALIERGFGRGRVVLFTSSVDLDWNDWARAVDGSYVVTMLETVQYAARRDSHPAAFRAGDTLTLSLSADRYDPHAEFRPPAYPDEPAVRVQGATPPDSAGETLALRGPHATRLGSYHVELTPRGGAAETRPLCVNLDPAESDLAVASAADLDAALVGVPHELVGVADGFLRDDQPARRELWSSVLAALVLVLLAEQALAWWFGRVEAVSRAGAPPLTVPGR
ncbi:MAG: BatA domain-containing protein [Phycisphaerae bacterium]